MLTSNASCTSPCSRSEYGRERFALRTNTHLSDDETVAKMGTRFIGATTVVSLATIVFTPRNGLQPRAYLFVPFYGFINRISGFPPDRFDDANRPPKNAIVDTMQVTIDIPDTLAEQFAATGKDPARIALEALALEGYCNRQLSEDDLRHLLVFDTRLQVRSFLTDHDVPLYYSVEDWSHDQQVADQSFARAGHIATR